MIVNVHAQGHMCMSPTLNLIVTLYIFFKKDPVLSGDVAQWIKHFLVNRV